MQIDKEMRGRGKKITEQHLIYISSSYIWFYFYRRSSVSLERERGNSSAVSLLPISGK